MSVTPSPVREWNRVSSLTHPPTRCPPSGFAFFLSSHTGSVLILTKSLSRHHGPSLGAVSKMVRARAARVSWLLHLLQVTLEASLSPANYFPE